MSWDDLEEEARAAAMHAGPRCGVIKMLEAIEAESGELARASVERTLANHRLTTSGIHKALEGRVSSYDLPSSYSLGRHRRDMCNCKRSGDE